MKKLKEYALYKGDTYLYGGTKKEISNYLGVSIKTVDHLLTPSYKKKRVKEDSNCYILIRVDD